MSGPVATARPLTAPQMPRAAPRRSAGRPPMSRVSVSGIMIAGADALDRAGGDQFVDPGCECGRGGGRGEDREPDDEEPAAAEAVAERGAEHQQDREGEGVGAHRPFEVLQRRRRGPRGWRAERW